MAYPVIKPGTSNHLNLSNIGVNTHAQIDTHISDTTIHFSVLDGLTDVDTTGVTLGQVLSYAGSPPMWVAVSSPGSSAAIWGNITGTLSNQTDLQLALDGKAPIVHTHVEADITDLQAYLLDITNEPITDLVDVNTTGATSGQVLTYAGSPPMWIATTPTSGVTDHTLLTNIGVNTHAAIDTHIADATLHFTEASIDHTAIVNIGVNTHAAIDTHIADATLHFTEASISITESQISDLQPYLLDITGEFINDLSDVAIVTPTNGQVLTYAGSPPMWIATTPTSGGATWGTITGTLSSQLDLQTALDLKIETASNLGTGDGVFAQKVTTDLEFKTLIGGGGIQITPSATELLIDSRRSSFFSHNGATTQTFTNTLITVLFPTIIRSDTAYTYNTGDITINTAGWYFIRYELGIGNTGTGRTSSETGVTVNSLTTFVPGSLGYAYHRNTANGNDSFTGSILIQLAAADVVRILTHRFGTGSTLTTLADACRLIIIETEAP